MSYTKKSPFSITGHSSDASIRSTSVHPLQSNYSYSNLSDVSGSDGSPWIGPMEDNSNDWSMDDLGQTPSNAMGSVTDSRTDRGSLEMDLDHSRSSSLYIHAQTLDEPLDTYFLSDLEFQLRYEIPAASIQRLSSGRASLAAYDLNPVAIYKGVRVAIRRLSNMSISEHQSMDEVRASVRIHGHPNLLCFMGYIQEDNTIGLVSEYMAMGSLRAYIESFTRTSSLDFSYARIQMSNILLQVVSALAYMHTQIMVSHNRLSTDNVLLRRSPLIIVVPPIGIKVPSGDGIRIPTAKVSGFNNTSSIMNEMQDPLAVQSTHGGIYTDLLHLLQHFVLPMFVSNGPDPRSAILNELITKVSSGIDVSDNLRQLASMRFVDIVSFLRYLLTRRDYPFISTHLVVSVVEFLHGKALSDIQAIISES